MSIDRYNEIASSTYKFDLGGITSFLPNPKDIDYRRGYIKRYFIQKSNDKSSLIYEISDSSISKFKNTPFYITISLDWRISGDPIEVKKSNSASIRIASEVIPKISLYLPNLLQFHQK